jgi:hypothetical protein
MVRRNKKGVTVSGSDLDDLKLALRKLLRPASVAEGHAQCPGCKKVLPIKTKEQGISGTCDPCWDRLFAPTKPVTGGTDGTETIPF